jgi:RNA polymerase sigma-70 factor (ECF subfamily)
MSKAAEAPDWAAVLERLIEGDRLAFLELSRLVTGFLVRWRAYDFRDEWDDLVQEVILAAVEAARGRRLRQPGAVVGYLRTAARYKFVDWLRRRRSEPLEPEREARPPELSWPAASHDSRAAEAEHLDLGEALKSLPERQQRALLSVYVEGHTYDEAALSTGIPLGSLKRYLREGLVALRAALEPGPPAADPGEAAAPTSPGGVAMRGVARAGGTE